MERGTEKRSGRPLPELERGRTFAGHRIEVVAGRGPVGVVYRAVEVEAGRTVALKVFDHGAAASVDTAALDHPHAIPVYAVGEAGGRPFVAMRWVSGTDLRALIAHTGGLDPRRAARIAAQVGDALDAAHRRGLVHGNVKPSNVLIEDGDRAWLSDFGLGFGPSEYAAPEGRAVDARADVYALGCVLFEALTGAVPRGELSASARRMDLPPEIDAVLARATATDPKRRYPSAGDLGRAALATLAGEIVVAPVRSVATGPAAPASRPHDVPVPALPTSADGTGPRRPTVVYGAPWNAATRPAAVYVPRQAADPLQASAASLFQPTPPEKTPSGPTTSASSPVAVEDLPEAAAVEDRAVSAADRTPLAAIRRIARPRLRRALIAAVAVLLIAAGAIAARDEEDDRSGSVTRLAGSKVRVDRVDLGARAQPGTVVADRDAAYVIDKAAGRIVSVGAASRRVEGSVDLGEPPAALIRDPRGDRLWASICGRRNAIAEVRIDHGRMIGGAPVRLRRKPNRLAVLPNGELAVLSRRDDGATLSRMNAQTRRGVGRPRETSGATTDVVAGGPGLVVGTAFPPVLTTYSPRLEALETIALDFDGTPTQFAVRKSTAWVVFFATVLFPAGDEKSGDPLPGTVVRLDLRSGQAKGTPITVGRGASDIAIDGGVVWVANKTDGTVTRIDEKTGRLIGRPIEVGPIGGRLAAANGVAWVTGERDLIRLEPA